MTSDYDDLATLADALYRADLARLQDIAREEERLRSELASLSERERQTTAMNPNGVLAIQQVGGDVLWKAWLGRKRAEINRRLALAMARKIAATQALKHSFGRASAATDLRHRALGKLAARRAGNRLVEEQQQMVQKALRARI